ncbi:hypothetical protein [Paenirhodobacter enshiensis]|uniref:DUF3299 domain-containing protein n=1 Tax=Paenirhodobacter enshiensis TaxID=1105367 RepID=A0A086XR72_9RHOB|nr:hypothetical protein [Paenirhodobacter enshiensis]KFI24522.1 hypothetical protein CG50_09810 [Paenirhodobacter enshiensis]
MPFALRRRQFLAALPALASLPRMARAEAPELTFDQLYGGYSALGLTFSDKVKLLDGQSVRIRGFMAPPLKAEAQFFVLTRVPMALCPFCSTDADWPDNIVVVYLEHRQTFVQPNRTIEVTGRLEHGSWVDPDTGFVSQLRLRDASFGLV